MSQVPLPLLRTWFRFLFLDLTREEADRLDRRFLVAGLIATWLVGLGRYWDHPNAKLLQYLGVGSVVYVFLLAGLLYVVLKDLSPRPVSYRKILTMVTMTAPPAVLYAIPVERFLTLQDAQSANMWFLAAVALWRVLLLGRFVIHDLETGPVTGLAGMMLPITGIIWGLGLLNLEQAVFEFMSGVGPDRGTSADAAYELILLLMLLSPPVFLVSAMICLIAVHRKRIEEETRKALE